MSIKKKRIIKKKMCHQEKNNQEKKHQEKTQKKTSNAQKILDFLNAVDSLYKDIENWLKESIRKQIVSTKYDTDKIVESEDVLYSAKYLRILYGETTLNLSPLGILQHGGLKESGDVLGVITLYNSENINEEGYKLLFKTPENKWCTNKNSEIKFVDQDYFTELIRTLL